jgi:hypothetical protein
MDPDRSGFEGGRNQRRAPKPRCASALQATAAAAITRDGAALPACEPRRLAIFGMVPLRPSWNGAPGGGVAGRSAGCGSQGCDDMPHHPIGGALRNINFSGSVAVDKQKA